MNKIYLLALAIALPAQAATADTESVYAWGTWAQNIQPAAGQVARIAPAPVVKPDVNFRPNENPSFNRVDLVAQAAADAATQAAANAATQAAANAATQAAANAAAQAAAILSSLVQDAAANNSAIISGVGVAATSSIDVNATPSL